MVVHERRETVHGAKVRIGCKVAPIDHLRCVFSNMKHLGGCHIGPCVMGGVAFCFEHEKEGVDNMGCCNYIVKTHAQWVAVLLAVESYKVVGSLYVAF